MCRPPKGDCDKPEYCTGDSPFCPKDELFSSYHMCRVQRGVCDEPEYCDGYSKDCPPDKFKDSFYECRPSSGICDLPEYCTGSSPDCPDDKFRDSNYICRDKESSCDFIEYCTGSSAICPYDVYAQECQCSTNNERICVGNIVRLCKDGKWVDYDDCSIKGVECKAGSCSSCAQPEGAACNIDTNPCCKGLSCVLFTKYKFDFSGLSKDSKCYKDCTNDQTVCSSTQQCISWTTGQSACFETTTIANGTFSNCKSYADGEEPGQTDQLGSASIKFTLGGISYNFTACFGDFQYIDQEGNYWVIQIVDTSKLQTKLIAYLYDIIVDETEHTVGQHQIGEKIQPVIYELVLDKQYNTTKSVLHGFGIDGTLNFIAVGTGQKKPTSGAISNVSMIGYDNIICDNSGGNPCQ